MCITNQYFLFINQLYIENNELVIGLGEKQMKNTPLMENRNRLKKVMIDTFQKEVQPLNSQFRSILIDDMITTFYNRLNVMKKIQNKQ